jgi:hypothetical protein
VGEEIETKKKTEPSEVQEEATIEELLKLDLCEEYAAAIVRIDVPKDMHMIRVVLKDRLAPVGVISMLSSRLRELPFFDAAYEGEDLTTGNMWFRFESVEDHVKRMSSLVDDYREIQKKAETKPEQKIIP